MNRDFSANLFPIGNKNTKLGICREVRVSRALKLLIVCAASLVVAAFIAILFNSNSPDPAPVGGGKSGSSLMQFQ